jgi:GT2 family glycosyltransferase
VDSLLASRGVQVIPSLVDNASPGPVPEWAGEISGLLFSRSPSNEGLTAGNNRAFAMLEPLDTDYTLILNNDTEVFPDTIRLLVDHLESRPEVGIAAPAILYADRPDLVWSAGGDFIPWRMFVRQRHRQLSDLPEGPVPVDAASGCAILLRTDELKKAGLQDSGLFVYYEDDDLCFRIRRMGLGITLVPASRVLHHVSISMGGAMSPAAIYFTHRNRYVVASRYLPPHQLAVFSLYYLAVTLLKTVIYPLRGSPALVRWMWKATLHGIQRRTGIVPDGLLNRRKES